jgi:cytochrome c
VVDLNARERQQRWVGLRIAGSAALALILIGGCAGPDGAPDEAPRAGERPAAAGLTVEEMEKGIGPVTRVDLGPLDEELAHVGGEIYAMKCASCHQMEERFVGPPLGDVMERRTPEFVMNMILNPAEMVERHPVVREMLAEYFTPMPFQNVSEPEARAIVEYLRTVGSTAEAD